MDTPKFDNLVADIAHASGPFALANAWPDITAGMAELGAWKGDVDKRLAALEAMLVADQPAAQ